MTANSHPHSEPGCRAVSEVLSRVGDKWTVLIVKSLQLAGGDGRRFNDLKRDIGGISQQMLTRSLRSLERDGMVSRTVHPTVPPQVEYRLTELGLGLSKAFCGVWLWAEANFEAIESARGAYARDNPPKPG